MASRRPSKKPSRRDTLQVDAAWLLVESSPALRPPRPPRRETMEVKLEWIEEEAATKRRAPPPIPREEPHDPSPPRRSHGPPRQRSKRPPALPARVAHKVVSHGEWTAASAALAAKERDLAKLAERVGRERRELPWERVEQRHVFETPRGSATLAELFGRRSQLVVYQLAFDARNNVACGHCAAWADDFEGAARLLEPHDVAFVAVSLAPLPKLQAFQRRAGWTFDWVASGDALFSRADGAMDVFYKDSTGAVFRTYSADARVAASIRRVHHVLSLVPKGRDQGGDGPP